MKTFKENILNSSHKYSRYVTMHFINFFDFIEYNFSAIVFMISIEILFIYSICGTLPLAFIHIYLIYFLKVEMVLREGIFAI